MTTISMHIKAVCFFCYILTVAISFAETPDKPGWKLVWSDEFDGPEIDRSHWSFEKGFVRNKEPQYYTDRAKNAFIENGNLVIATLREDFEGAPYTSAGLHTRGKKSFQYGRIEMRAKLPSGNAIWPAFWTLGTEGRHPGCGEIDIVELWGGPNGRWGKNKDKGWGDGICSVAAHWGGNGQSARAEGRIHALPDGEKYSDKYHVFAIEWDENEIVWFVDENEVDRMKIESEGQKSSFRRPHYLLVNTAISPEKVAQMKTEDLPAHFYIDYIRVYQQRGDEILIPAKNMSTRSNDVVASDGQWSSLAVLHGRDGFMEWTAPIEAAGAYYLHVCYASQEPRPVKMEIDGKIVSEKVLSKATGGFHSADLRWETFGPFDWSEGKHVFRFSVKNTFMPHFRGLIVSKNQESPETDIFDKREQEVRLAELKKSRSEMEATRKEVREWFGDVDSVLFVSRKTFQSTHYYTDFIDGCVHFGSDLCILSLKDGSVRTITPESMKPGIIGRCNLSHDGKKVIFDFKAKIGEGFRIWEIGIDGNNLRQLTFPPEDEAARIKKNHHYGHRQYHHHTDDMHPCYLPDGGICFVSTRCEFSILCDGWDVLTTSVLYRADGDGKNIEKLSNNSVSEANPAVMHDGRILYTRWEYVDNGAVTNKGIWSVRPDGTGSSEIYGANIVFPPVFHVARPIPGSSDLFVCIGAPHMPLGVGTVMRIDTRFNRRSGDPVTYITPEVDVRHQTGWDSIPGGATKPFQPEGLIHTGHEFDGRGNTMKGPLFMDPFPIDQDRFIVSYNPDKEWNTPDAYGLYLIDGRGTRKLLHLQENNSCWSAIPIQARTKEGVSHGVIDPELAKEGLAQAVVTDVYHGLDGVERGTIKYIRINEHVPRPWAASRHFWTNKNEDAVDQQHSVISLNAHLGLKLQDGIVPVEEDGSANFLVKADKNIFFQVLDENFMEVQRERTFINFRPGEVRSCVGCHEQSGEVPKTGAGLPLALKRAPRQAGPQPGETSGARPIHYPTDVQPVLDRHCISCHSGENPKGNLVLTGELTTHFNRSYEELMKRDSFPVIGENHPKAGNNHYVPPYTLGSHASKLVKRITDPKSPCYTDMSQEDRIRITTWVDSNGQYYGTYFGKKNLKYKDEPDFRPVPTYEDAAR